ncbi:MraY family glycosyltransferase [Aquimarina sp. AU474]|uniref:MraY family glycosyltransferase n=1 Tax=Aquimarina sp. AU474 TaxID=2108529 RepID=UPI001F21507D|nr:MraY family glycosyltransferase [Aquimarina sp. AU474]
MPLYYPILFFFGAYALTYFTIPKIIGLVENKRLMDEPNNRSSHKTKTPTLGGVSFFYTIIFTLFFLKQWDSNSEAMYIIPGLTILLIIGLKDDLLVLAPFTKLLAQLCALGFVLLNENFIVHSLNGFLGIHEIPIYLYYLVGGFVMLTVINAYNLIDGIDGLAAIVGIVILIMYATIFYFTNDFFYTLLCLALNGSLIAFLSFNLSSTKKIFMGDTGSLIVGFIISILTLKFLTLTKESYNNLPFLLENGPIIAMSILIVPLFDTARVFTIRIANKKSPFSPDRNHIHHILIDYLSLSHRQASLFLGGFNLLFVVLFIFLGSTSKNGYLLIFLIIIIIGLGYLFFRLDFSFSNLKKKLILRNKVDNLKKEVKKNRKKLTNKKKNKDK